VSGHGDDHGQRLSALDGSFLRLESPQAHMHVGWSAVLSAPVDAPRPTAQALRERAASRLHQVPWCRWRLESTPLALSEPRWVDDPDFDLSERIVDLTDPDDRVSPATLAALCCDVLSTPLDRSQPLWQIFVIPCLEDGRVAMASPRYRSSGSWPTSNRAPNPSPRSTGSPTTARGRWRGRSMR